MRRSVGVCAMAGMAHLGGRRPYCLLLLLTNRSLRDHVQMFMVPKIQMFIKRGSLYMDASVQNIVE